MSSAQLSSFLRHLRRVLHPAAAEGASDAHLLQRFVQERDQQAFELLIWRHGLMVLNVCRRVLHHEHDAEDAFQATFLALARKADAIGKRESLGSWLYKVAYRIALRARNTIPLRSLREEPLPDPSSREPINDLLWRELAAAVDEEIHRLPEKYRVALVLCHLEGQTIESAARGLACPSATVGTRLARARTLLRRRLARRGFDLSSLGELRNIVAVLSSALVNSTVQAALLGTAEQAAAAGLISTSVAALTNGALRAMSLTRWTAITVMILTLSLASGGGAMLVHRVLAAEPEKTVSAADGRNASTEKHQPTAVMLQWQLTTGQPFYQIFTTETSQVMKVMNNDVRQKQRETFYLQWTPEKTLGGKWILAQKILGAKLDIDLGNNPPNVAQDISKALVGAELKWTLDAKTLEILRLDGRAKLVKKLGETNPAMKPLIDKLLSEDALKEMADASFGLLMGPARPGDSWTKRRQMDMGPIGKYQNHFQCTYEGRKGKLDKIQVKMTPKYLPPRHDQQGIGGLPFRIDEKTTLRGRGTGVLYFDRTKGRLDRSEMSTELGGTLVIKIGGQKTDVEFSQTQETRVQTMETNPVGAIRFRNENERLRNENERLRRRLQAVDEALHREDAPKK
ncbi:MAG TPA: sigma-70 family RNA polymerase sigma factor [Gemmataceae bacterium]|nr:sigma-70 family RNA polymerase sigma factor [Gemmataceae bacterium]